MITAIIAAAGSGSRFGSDKPKQFIEIGGVPLIIHTLRKFEHCADIDKIVAVAGTGDAAKIRALADTYGISKLAKVVIGGNTRAKSVLNGLNAVAETTSIVVVHDGARPLVTGAEISATVEMAKKTGAACLTATVTDTIKTVKNGVITGTVDRSHLLRALTPQAFQIEILRKAFAAADPGEAITDESTLVERFGYEVTVVEGSARNIKITYKEDLRIAEIFLEKQ